MLVDGSVCLVTDFFGIAGRQCGVKHVSGCLTNSCLRLLFFTPIEHQFLTLSASREFVPFIIKQSKVVFVLEPVTEGIALTQISLIGKAKLE